MEDIHTVDIEVGELIRKWIISNTGSDIIKISNRSNLWAIVKQNLDLRPEGYIPPQDRSQYISFEIPDTRHHKIYNVPAGKMIYPSAASRCCISPSGQGAIKRYLENQLRGSFLMYMQGKYGFGEDKHEMITHAIGEFLLEYDLPMNDKIISTFQKRWWRFRKKGDFFQNILFL